MSQDISKKNTEIDQQVPDHLKGKNVLQLALKLGYLHRIIKYFSHIIKYDHNHMVGNR